MATYNKESLFETYFLQLNKTLTQLETFLEVQGLREQVLGTDAQKWELEAAYSPPAAVDARAKVKRSYIWDKLSTLFDYAVGGQLPPEDAVDLVMGAEEMLLSIYGGTEVASGWADLLQMGDGRFALDDGQTIGVRKLALLASVDERTVRNAISSGALSATKVNGETHVENASAKLWLTTRRAYTPTQTTERVTDLDSITTAIQFAGFLTSRREDLGLSTHQKKLVAFHPSVDAKAMGDLELGVFNLPIDAAYALADFYQLDRVAFLNCVMRVFFRDQLAALEQSFGQHTSGSAQ